MKGGLRIRLYHGTVVPGTAIMMLFLPKNNSGLRKSRAKTCILACFEQGEPMAAHLFAHAVWSSNL